MYWLEETRQGNGAIIISSVVQQGIPSVKKKKENKKQADRFVISIKRGVTFAQVKYLCLSEAVKGILKETVRVSWAVSGTLRALLGGGHGNASIKLSRGKEVQVFVRSVRCCIWSMNSRIGKTWRRGEADDGEVVTPKRLSSASPAEISLNSRKPSHTPPAA